MIINEEDLIYEEKLYKKNDISLWIKYIKLKDNKILLYRRALQRNRKSVELWSQYLNNIKCITCFDREVEKCTRELGIEGWIIAITISEKMENYLNRALRAVEIEKHPIIWDNYLKVIEERLKEKSANYEELFELGKSAYKRYLLLKKEKKDDYLLFLFNYKIRDYIKHCENLNTIHITTCHSYYTESITDTCFWLENISVLTSKFIKKFLNSKILILYYFNNQKFNKFKKVARKIIKTTKDEYEFTEIYLLTLRLLEAIEDKESLRLYKKKIDLFYNNLLLRNDPGNIKALSYKIKKSISLFNTIKLKENFDTLAKTYLKHGGDISVVLERIKTYKQIYVKEYCNTIIYICKKLEKENEPLEKIWDLLIKNGVINISAYWKYLFRFIEKYDFNEKEKYYDEFLNSDINDYSLVIHCIKKSKNKELAYQRGIKILKDENLIKLYKHYARHGNDDEIIKAVLLDAIEELKNNDLRILYISKFSKGDLLNNNLLETYFDLLESCSIQSFYKISCSLIFNAVRSKNVINIRKSFEKIMTLFWKIEEKKLVEGMDEIFIKFAQFEESQNEIERARSIFKYGAGIFKNERFWKIYEEFELLKGDEITYMDFVNIRNK
ncbi:Pre-mRNA-splicing factor SYF1 [Astathelohania contejeani]|uniref:Pre-mRNA-splicing factor SYF1 n=1 Tax=Astathelohania contejeani TaxID=164912 RepID=A0ABQ7HWM1_9MICR|nr:Pre-mRNA-splicing factor SYF1 [Thelohania contejeani]